MAEDIRARLAALLVETEQCEVSDPPWNRIDQALRDSIAEIERLRGLTIEGRDLALKRAEAQLAEAQAKWLDKAENAILSAGDGSCCAQKHVKALRAALAPTGQATGPGPHPWTPDEKKQRCLVCGDNVWGRHRFQATGQAEATESKDERR